MPPQPRLFITNDSESPTLRVFCPDPQTVVTSFEDYLPAHKTVRQNSGPHPDLPARLCLLKDNYDYRAYLPKDRPYDGHLLTPLNHHRPEHVQRDGRWFVDDETRNLWRSLDINITYTITVISHSMLTELDHHVPNEAVKYGFAHSHKDLRGLQVALRVSRNALVHRLAYVAYLISLRYQWDQDLVDQAWWIDFKARCTVTWVDSVWDAIYQQWRARNFVGVVVIPAASSVRWLGAALRFGVPIWVKNPQLGGYEKLDGGFVMKQWEPTNKQVTTIWEAENAKHTRPHTKAKASPPLPKHPAHIHPTTNPPANLPLGPSAQPQPQSHSTILPEDTQWYESWEGFFQKRDEANASRLGITTQAEKVIWEERVQESKGSNQPGEHGARVFIWESCDSGGFLRILQSRFEVAQDWDFYFKEALVFSAQDNTWDHCPFLWQPAIRDGPPDDLDNNGGHIMEHWYIKPNTPTPLQAPSVLVFLYRRYGFLSTKPCPIPEPTTTLDDKTAYRIVGLSPETEGLAPETEGLAQKEDPPPHLPTFLTSILHGQLPAGHCDLCPNSPPGEMFPPSRKTEIYNTVFFMQSRLLSPDPVFIFTDSPNGQKILLAVHEPLSILQLFRDGTSLNLHDVLGQLLCNGSQFTALYPKTQPPTHPCFSILSCPVREAGWSPRTEEFQAYMSRLKTFFLERPYALAAALSRGGIAWRVAQEVLGTEGSISALRNMYPDQSPSIKTSWGTHWFHQLSEGEWFCLVGGYEVLTGA
jgi:hypothetical protein